MGLLLSHLKVAFRYMKKHTFYSIVNLLGLSFAIAFVFLAFRFIQTELNYDQFHSNKENIYRLYHTIIDKETGAIKAQSAVTAIPLAKDLSEEVADIQSFTRVASSTAGIVVKGENYEEKITFVDPDFFKLFDFPIFSGSAFTKDQALSVLISKEKALQLFGRSDPINELITAKINNEDIALKVIGLIDAKRGQSSLEFDFLANMELFKKVVGEKVYQSYKYGMVENYVLSNATISKEDLSQLFTQAFNKFSADDKDQTRLQLQALPSIHLEDKIVGNALYTSPTKLYIMSALALLVLLIAVINFITLSTSHALLRSKEIGLRSTLGAIKQQLKRQMIQESLLLNIIASLLGLGLAYATLPHFASLLETQLAFSFGLKEAVFLASLCFLIALVTGNLQALTLVKNNAIHALKSKISGKNSIFNQSLLVLQFALSILLIIGAIVMQQQMKYIQNKDLGYDKERLIEINLGNTKDLETAQQLVKRFKAKALQNRHILDISATMNNAREPWTELMFEQLKGQPEGLFYNQIDPAYLQTMQIELKEGEAFRINQPNAQNAILVNEALVRHFAWDQPLEQQIPGKNFSENHQIIGVVKDFHFSSMHQKIEPLILALDLESIGSGITGLSTYVWPANLYQLVVRVGEGDLTPILKDLEQIWSEIAPENAFVYHFVDQVLEKQYATEKRWAAVINWASLFAIFIAWLGLLGLMRLSLQKRIKEIGIRKVLGASTSKIISLLSKEYLLLVVLGNIIALPIAWILMGKWLNSFSYRTNLSPTLFLLAGICVLAFTFLSLGLQSFKTANANPTDALKME
jgi:putative ABC transport system permease protein